MQFGANERAAAIQVGATLLFGMLIVSMALYQATVVPDQNAEVEYNHNQEVQGQLQELRNAVVSVPGGGNGESVTVDLGTRFPSRTLFVNPPAPSGSLRTVGTGDDDVNITVDNAAAAGETSDYWDGSARTFDTGAITYQPRYSEYGNAPTTVYEQSVLYNRFDGANVSISDQRIVDGRQITLVALNGSLSESASGSKSVSVRAVSTSRNAVAVEGDGEPINVTVPTRLDEDTWNETLAPEYDENGGNIVGQYYEPVPGEEYALLSIELDPSETYDLRMAKVGVGSGVSEEADDLYLTDVGGTNLNVEAGATKAITVEVRDRFNNPVSGEDVTLTANNGEFEGTNSASTTNSSQSDGQTTVTYEAPNDGSSSDTITATIGSGSTPETVEFDVTVESNGGSSGGEQSAYSVDWEDPDGDNPSASLSSCTADDCTWDVGADSDSSLALRAATTPTVEGLNTEFAVNDSSIGTLSGSDSRTDTSGEATTTLDALANGTVKVYVVTGGSSDAINVSVENVSGNAAPSASFTVSDSNPDTGETVEFDPSGSSDDGSINEYRWDFDGDGAVDRTTTSATTVNYTYGDDGSYDAELTVEDDGGKTGSDTQTITVNNRGPSASYTFSPDKPIQGETATFDASNSADPDGSVSTYEWDWDGDGTYDESTTTATTDHTFANTGSRSVTLRVTDDNGATSTTSQTVRVIGGRPTLAYVTNNAQGDAALRTIDGGGRITPFDAGGSLERVGPPKADLDGDNYVEVPFVTGSGYINVIDRNNETQTIQQSPSVSGAGITVGTWDGSETSVFFVSGNQQTKVFRTTVDGSETEVANFSQDLSDVVGIGDVDDDNARELVVRNADGNLVVLNDEDDTSPTTHEIGSKLKPANNNGPAIGQVADYNGDGQERIAIVDGSNNVRLIACDFTRDNKPCENAGGTVKLTIGVDPKVAPFGAGDLNDDGTPELVFGENENSPAELYYVNITGDSVGDEGYVIDENGDRVNVAGHLSKGSSGAASLVAPHRTQSKSAGVLPTGSALQNTPGVSGRPASIGESAESGRSSPLRVVAARRAGP